MYVKDPRRGGDALDKMEETLARERALSQLAHEIMLNILLPDVRIRANECAHERVRVAWRRPRSSVSM